MQNVRHILVPVDLSENAAPMVDWAAGLAIESGASIHLLHVAARVPPVMPTFDSWDLLYTDLEEQGRRKLQAMAAEVEKLGITSDSEMVFGNPAQEIVKQAAAIPADLIVMATHGRHGLERFLLGSTTEGVLREAPCPVITLRPAGGVAS